MGQTAYVYVGKESAENFGIGKDRGVWGWETSVLSKSANRDDAASLQPGDLLVLGHKAPGGPRIAEENWRQVSIEQVLFMEVTRPLYDSADVVWPDRPYPHRIDVRLVDARRQIGVDELGHRGMDALRLSGCRQGAPILYPGQEVVELLGEPELEDIDEDDLDDEFEGEVNGVALTTVRREQAWLKARAFGSAPMVTCDLCGERLPRKIVRAAHIKRRADCTEAERRRWRNNILAACTLGCDDLFEHGFIYVDDRLRIQAGPQAQGLESVLAFIDARLSGRKVSDRNGLRAPMFEAHRQRVL